MDRNDLKEFRYNELTIKSRIESMRERRMTIDNISPTITDMPKRKQDSTRQYGWKNCKINRRFRRDIW